MRDAIAPLVGLASADRWTFARLRDAGAFADQLISDGADPTRELEEIRAEFVRQRAAVPAGPRICALRRLHDPYVTGATLILADRHTEFGVLTLMRTAARGALSSTEARVLTLALHAACERLAAARLYDAVAHDVVSPPNDAADCPVMYVLDRDCLRVVLPEDDGIRRLPAVLENAVREITRSAPDARAPVPVAERACGPLRLRTQPLDGDARYIGVIVERRRSADPIARAAATFAISPRESQVLALLLDGASLATISASLHIASSTVQDHLKSLLHKTATQNRSEMIAKVLGWERAAAR